MKRVCLLSILLFMTAGFAFSVDFGLLTDQKLEVDETMLTYNPVFTPWFSWNGGQGLSVYVSGQLSLKYLHYDQGIPAEDGWKKPLLLGEVSRTVLSYRINQNFSIEAGRINYSDALELTASGLFDGIRAEIVLPLGNISTGAFYTGFLYKETANILMTGHDKLRLAEPWDLDNVGAYFASRRVFIPLRWNAPLGDGNTFTLEALAQIDCNGNEETLHSEYGEFRMDFFLPNNMALTVGALMEAMQDGQGNNAAAVGALARLHADVPGPLNDGLNFTFKFGSGSWNDAFAAFTPVSSPGLGSIFSGTIAGLVMAQGDYGVRIHETLFVEYIQRFFMPSFDDPALNGLLYGGESWLALAWQPLDDIRLTVGGGVFASADSDPVGKFTASLTLAF